MTRLTYLDFDLRIVRTADGYRAWGSDSHGREAARELRSPFSDAEIDDVRRCLGTSRARRRWWRTREMEAGRRFGRRLFEAVFQGELLGIFRRSLADARREGAGLRLRLRLAEVPELAGWPWEYLHDAGRNRFFALSNETPVVRYLELAERIQPLAVRPPLRVLVLPANPEGFSQLDVEQEWLRLNQALADLREKGLVVLDRLAMPTLAALQHQLRGGEFHVLHFIGHGGFHERTGEGVLVLEDESGQGRPVRAEDLAVVLRDHSALRLAVLNACEGARTSARDPFAGVAPTLIQQGIPAVVAMQSEIQDGTGLTLAHELYSALADGYPVDASLTEARKRISGQGSLEWGLPVLYLRAPDGCIFDVEEPEGGAEVSSLPSGPGTIAARCREFLTAHHRKILALATAVPTLVYGLGLFTLRGREGLLGLEEPLTYSHESTVITGLDVLWSLPWNALFALFYAEPWLLAGAWGPLVALALISAANRWLGTSPGPTRHRWITAGLLLTLTWVLLLFAVRFYMAALYPPHSDQAPGPAFDIRPGGTRIESTEFEVVSWLKNDDERNEHRRQALAGLVGWLLLAAVGAGYRAYRRRDLPRRWWLGLVIGYALMVALVVSLVPRSHVVAAWGLKYPQLKVVDEACDAELFEELSKAGCCLFDVSHGGRPRKTLLWGDGCSTDPGFRTWSEDQESCLVGQVERVISDDC